MTQLIHSKMPKIPTAGMTWTVSREKHPDPALRIDSAIIQNQHQPLFLNSIRIINSTSHQQITVSTVPQSEKQGDKLL